MCGAVTLFALSSDRRRERGYRITAAIMFTLTGLIALVTASTNASRYAALYVVQYVFLIGTCVPAPPSPWLGSAATGRPGKRTLVLGFKGWGGLGASSDRSQLR
ncbi:hypothetical protein VTG60DRAFT_6596 [Thermothelomyces hinnuleus]